MNSERLTKNLLIDPACSKSSFDAKRALISLGVTLVPCIEAEAGDYVEGVGTGCWVDLYKSVSAAENECEHRQLT